MQAQLPRPDELARDCAKTQRITRCLDLVTRAKRRRELARRIRERAELAYLKALRALADEVAE
ncbi:MAG: hypothetical protein AB7H88_21575 [Vicinamibacterales bacterium]